MVVKGARKSTVQQTWRVMYSVISSKLKTVKEANGFQYEMYRYPWSAVWEESRGKKDTDCNKLGSKGETVQKTLKI